MNNYRFTDCWFNSQDIIKFLPKYLTKKSMLEIGSYEGMSTVWFLENILVDENSTITCIDPWTSYSQNENSFDSYGKSDTEWNFQTHKETFIHNILVSGHQDKVTTLQGYSNEILPKLILENKKYDLIFIDGNHTSPFVITDAVMSWYLLEKGGVMIFDDYLWGDTTTSLSPKLAIDSFIACFNHYIEVIWSEYTLAIKKVK